MLSDLSNALLIHNPSAGNGGGARLRGLDGARRILASAGIHTDLVVTRRPGDAMEIARRAAADGRQLVIACGGDGTLNEVVNGLATQQNGHRLPLALLPGGTANVLAKELGLPWDIPRAAQCLVRGQLRNIALGLATPLERPERKRYFISVAGAGPDGVMVYSLDLDLKARLGILAYWWEGVRQIFRYDFPRFRVVTSGKQLEATLIIVGRTKHYGGPFRITTEADLLQDRFELAALTTQSGLRYLSYLPALWFGDLRAQGDVHFWKSDALVCEPLHRQPVYAQVDGEPLARLPVEFRIVPRAITLLIPRVDSAQESTPAA